MIGGVARETGEEVVRIVGMALPRQHHRLLREQHRFVRRLFERRVQGSARAGQIAEIDRPVAAKRGGALRRSLVGDRGHCRQGAEKDGTPKS